MIYKSYFLTLILFPFLLFSGGKRDTQSALNSLIIDSLEQIASTEGFRSYSGNPVIKPGPEGSWDAGSLGSMTILRANAVYHIYYEAWGIRTEKEWDASEYETLQIGHATSKDGIYWTKDPNNPVLTHGEKGDWDETGVWDPYVIYEDGIYKMWYGGGGGRKPNFGWAYAVSNDGTHFKKYGLIGVHNQSGVEDDHVLHDKKSGPYYMYYWHSYDDSEGLFCVTSPTETGFDFSKSVFVNIEGDDSFWKKFGQVLKNEEGWHMFYSNYIPPYGCQSIVQYATSEDGIHWKAKNEGLLYGLDADLLQITDNLYLMAYDPENHFDRKDADIRIAVYNGKLSNLASKPPLVKINTASPNSSKKFTIALREDGPHRFYFKPDSEVIISDKKGYTINAFYEFVNGNVHIIGENLNLQGTYDRERLLFKNKSDK